MVLDFEKWTAPEGETNGVKHGASTIEVHVVTDATAGEYPTATGATRVDKGSVLVKTYRPDVYDVLSEKTLRDNGYDPE